MKISKLFLGMFAFAAAALSSCENNEFSNATLSDNKIKITLTGSGDESESMSKTYLANTNGSVYFHQNDEISVFDGTFNNKFVALQEGAKSDFSGSAKDVNTYYILCPYQETATYTNGKITATLPSTQFAIRDNYDPQACLSVATCAKSSAFTLKNVGAILRLNTIEPFTKVVLKSIGGESIVGTATINPSTAAATILTGNSEVELVPSNNNIIEAGVYYISVLPSILSKGIELNFYTADNKVKVKKFQQTITIGQGKGLNCGKVSSYDETKDASDIEQPEQGGSLEPTQPVEGLSFTADDYKKVLWMTTRFYGAQRQGNGVNWVTATLGSDEYAGGKSFLKDSDNGYDLVGGWSDCGDHVLFGQTFFYSVYTLLLGYSEFQSGYGDYYSSDYHGYIQSGNYSWAGAKGAPNGIPDILDECKYATDWIKKAVRSSSKFYYQKGDGNADHSNWKTSPAISKLTKSEGGEADGSRQILSASGNVTDMAALAGASLAVMSRVYARIDNSYATECLDKAKVAYDFVMNTPKGITGAPGFYDPKDNYWTDITILCAELFRTTGDPKYKTAMENAASNWVEYSWSHGWVYCYTKTHDAAAYLLATIDNKYKEAGKNALNGLVESYVAKASGNRFDQGDYSWGYLRYPANQAFIAGLANKLNGDSKYSPYIAETIDYIMGKNSNNFSFIVGFGNKFPMKPHHRNIYHNDQNAMGSCVLSMDYPWIEFGFMAGGTNDGSYQDAIDCYVMAEGGIDYNAGLVGALAYICSSL